MAAWMVRHEPATGSSAMPNEAKRLRSVKDENRKLKRLLADTKLDNVAQEDLLGKNGDARFGAGGCRPSQG
jgi:hypothetical protein